ncbi:MAG: MFS transporter [Acidimicrobiales bacterium]
MRFASTPQNRQLQLLALALVLSMSTWFSTAAVLSQLRATWNLSSSQASWLTIAVQLGFVAGAVSSSITNLADRMRPLRLIFLGASGAAVANAVLVVVDGFAPALSLRFLTGVFLAAVYPPALKAMSAWYHTGRGLALGVMIGALTVGSALPHLLNGLGGVDWQVTLLSASALTLAGGILVERFGVVGPHAQPSAIFDLSQLGNIVRDRKFRLASLGYFGHMWELYAMWAWIAAFYTDALGSSRQASFVAFSVIAAGGAGSVYAGIVSDRTSRAQAAALAMRWSGSIALFIGFLVDIPAPALVALGLIWGFWVVADSAQFSTIVSETCPPAYIGTALTMQLAAGFVLTVFTIFLVPVVRDAHGWGWAFMMLAPGPLVGVWAMRALRSDADPRSTEAVSVR